MKRRFIWLAQLTIESLSDWSLAFPERDWTTDRPFSSDGFDNPWIPPTSIAGSIRAHLLSSDPTGRMVMTWMAGRGARDGSVADGVPRDGAGGDGAGRDRLGNDDRLPPTSTSGAGDAEAPAPDGQKFGSSRLRVVGTAFERVPEVRTVRQTAIDSNTGAAAHHSLRSSQVIEPGERLRVFLRSDADSAEDFAELEAALAGWDPMVGSGRTSGRAQSSLVGFNVTTLDLADPVDLRRWFQFGGATDFAALDRRIAITTAPAAPSLTKRFLVSDPLVLGGGEPDGYQPNLRRLRGAGDGALVLKGTEIKGVFRHRSEFILRSVGIEASDVAKVISVWFGGVGGRGRLMFLDSTIGGSQGGQPLLSERVHVSIDRFTGGAADNRLFSWEVIASGQFELAVADGRPHLPGWTDFLALLDWVVGDMCDGFVGFGAGTGRGYGTVRPIGTVGQPKPLTLELLNRIVTCADGQLAAILGDSDSEPIEVMT